jgi:hypothetical protein
MATFLSSGAISPLAESPGLRRRADSRVCLRLRPSAPVASVTIRALASAPAATAHEARRQSSRATELHGKEKSRYPVPQRRRSRLAPAYRLAARRGRVPERLRGVLLACWPSSANAVPEDGHHRSATTGGDGTSGPLRATSALVSPGGAWRPRGLIRHPPSMDWSEVGAIAGGAALVVPFVVHLLAQNGSGPRSGSPMVVPQGIKVNRSTISFVLRNAGGGLAIDVRGEIGRVLSESRRIRLPVISLDAGQSCTLELDYDRVAAWLAETNRPRMVLALEYSDRHAEAGIQSWTQRSRGRRTAWRILSRAVGRRPSRVPAHECRPRTAI